MTNNPLQVIKHSKINKDDKGKELYLPFFQEAQKADQECSKIYQTLSKRTKSLASPQGVFAVKFPWRIRVGGIRGFDDILMLVFHPVFGVPYIPAASLKGAARAWARQNQDPEIDIVLGFLDGDKAQAAHVEFLDAFPTGPCLDPDVCTPQWTDDLKYQPNINVFPSLKNAEFQIGLRATKKEYEKDIPKVRQWLENALLNGIGSRISAGYGRGVIEKKQAKSLVYPHRSDLKFEILTQGIHGADSTGNPEFRPTAIRGILRYWFRACALALYDKETASDLEAQLFGTISPRSREGNVVLSVTLDSDKNSNPSRPPQPWSRSQGNTQSQHRSQQRTNNSFYKYSGVLTLAAKSQEELRLVKSLLKLAVNIGGVGRGARRPLHRLNGRMRGCYWEISTPGYTLPFINEPWNRLFQEIKQSFRELRPTQNVQLSGYQSKNNERVQDVFIKGSSYIFLVETPDLDDPECVEEKDRGEGLKWFYGPQSPPYFKGGNPRNQGNINVGGDMGTPSFVWIRSIFPEESENYQVFTVFDVKGNSDRENFVESLKQRFPQNHIQVQLF